MKNHTCRNSLRLGVLVGGEQGGGDGMKVERRACKLGVGEGISVRVRGWDGLQFNVYSKGASLMYTFYMQ